MSRQPGRTGLGWISGIGQNKLARYGDEFLRVIEDAANRQGQWRSCRKSASMIAPYRKPRLIRPWFFALLLAKVIFNDPTKVVRTDWLGDESMTTNLTP